jgi:hypothetical protein
VERRVIFAFHLTHDRIAARAPLDDGRCNIGTR